MARTTLLALVILGLAAACPNACSGNGICGANDKCSCHQNWQGPDCSLRTCPFTLAWADTPDGTNKAHYYAECGNKGTCDRKTGECACFDGYEGKGCRRSTCPEGCSGHGTCEYIEELGRDWADRRNGPGHHARGKSWEGEQFTSSAIETTNVVARVDNSDVYDGYQYELWDAHKIQGCKCDLGYKGADCSQREVPRGDDPLTTVKSETQTQIMQIEPHTDAPADCTEDADCVNIQRGKCNTDLQSPKCYAWGEQDEFFMKFHDPYGGVWVTDAIPLGDDLSIIGTDAADDDLAKRVQSQLRSLPNGVLSDVEVVGIPDGNDEYLCERHYDGVQHISAYDQTTDGNYKNSKGSRNPCLPGTGSDEITYGYTSEISSANNTVDLRINMGNMPGQTGVQYLLELHLQSQDQSKGFFPRSKGVAVGGSSNSESQHTLMESNSNQGTDVSIEGLSELSQCSDRGLDDGEGQCECFDGYRGLACEEQEALV